MANLSKYTKAIEQSENQESGTPEEQLSSAMYNDGIEPPEDGIIFDGTLYKFDEAGGNAHWYIAFNDGEVPIARYGSFRHDINKTWVGEVGRELSFVESLKLKAAQTKLKELRVADGIQKKESARDDALIIWNGGIDADPENEYLISKGVSAHSIKQTGDGDLLIPMVKGSEMVNIQTIKPDGTKRFLKHGDASGARFTFKGDHGTVYMAEGYATGATIFEQTGNTVIIAFTSGNLIKVANELKSELGDMDVVIVADNDDSNDGIKKATEASNIIDAKVVMPQRVKGQGRSTDANDYYLEHGNLDFLSGDCEPTPTKEAYFESALDYCSEPAPIDWILKGWIQAKSLAMVHGPSGSGKTFVVLDMAMSVSSGKEFWNGYKIKTGPVVYLAGEGHHGLRSRVAAWAKYHSIDPKDIRMVIGRHAVDINVAEGFLFIHEQIKNLGYLPKMIVIDTLFRFYAGNENSAEDAKLMIDACDALSREFETTVLLVHHTGVSEEARFRARGSSAYKGAMQNEINIEHVKADDETHRYIRQQKQKDGVEIPRIEFELKPVEIDGWIDGDGEVVKSCVPVLIESEETKPVNYISDFIKIWDLAENDYKYDSTGARLPYISRSVVKDFIVDKMEVSEKYADKLLKPSAMIGIVYDMVKAGVMSRYDNGRTSGYMAAGECIKECEGHAADKGADSFLKKNRKKS